MDMCHMSSALCSEREKEKLIEVKVFHTGAHTFTNIPFILGFSFVFGYMCGLNSKNLI